MTVDNEELMQKLVRIGMIMRHIDGEGRCCKHGHGPHHGHGFSGGPVPGSFEPARFEMGEGVEHPHGPHGHGPGVPPMDGPDCHGPHGHGGRGPQGHHGHGPEGCGPHGRGHKGHRRGQARVLTMVSMQEGINQKDLAFLLGIRPQTLGEMLQKLEAAGLVQRAKSETDGRAIEVTLTDEGRARAAEIAERRALAAADIFAVLSDEEKEQLAVILDKLGAELDKHRPSRPGKPEGDSKAMQA